MQRIHHRLPGRVAQQHRPLLRGFQHTAQRTQPKHQRLAALQGQKQGLHLHGQRMRPRQCLTDLPPLPQAGLAQRQFGGNHGGRIKHGGIFQPVQHGVCRNVPGSGAQQTHEAGSGARGGQLPAGLVAHGHALIGQHGAHASGQHAVLRHQRHRPQAFSQPPQHAGGGALRLVFGVRGGLQHWLSRHTGRQKRQGQRPCPPAGPERIAQGVGLKTFQHHQQLTRGRKQNVSGISRGRSPGQRNLPNR